MPSTHLAQTALRRPRRWVFLLWAGVLLAPQVHSRDFDFSRDCMRVAVEGLILDTSAACIGAFRSDPAARAQFVQLIQVTMAQAEIAQRLARGSTTPGQSLRRLFDKASLEPGRVVGVGGAYYGAQ